MTRVTQRSDEKTEGEQRRTSEIINEVENGRTEKKDTQMHMYGVGATSPEVFAGWLAGWHCERPVNN